MEFKWDENKRKRVLEARGLDFLGVFDGRPVVTVPSFHSGEERWLSVGEIEGRLIVVIWTLRDERNRIVTMRRARHAEKGRYQALYGG